MDSRDDWVKVKGAGTTDDVIRRLTRTGISGSDSSVRSRSNDDWIKVKGARTADDVIYQLARGNLDQDTTVDLSRGGCDDGDEWVKVRGVKSVDEILRKLSDRRPMEPPVTSVVYQSGPALSATTPAVTQEPQHRQVIVVVPPPDHVQEPPPVYPPPPPRCAVPNDYVLQPTRRNDYSRSRPPTGVRQIPSPYQGRQQITPTYVDQPLRSTPPLTRLAPRPLISMSLPPPMEPPMWYEDEDVGYEDEEGPVESAEYPGYYLAGHFHAAGSGGVQQVTPAPVPPPGYYLAGYR